MQDLLPDFLSLDGLLSTKLSYRRSEIFTNLCNKFFCGVKFSEFYLIHEFFITVDYYNRDVCPESS